MHTEKQAVLYRAANTNLRVVVGLFLRGAADRDALWHALESANDAAGVEPSERTPRPKKAKGAP